MLERQNTAQPIITDSPLKLYGNCEDDFAWRMDSCVYVSWEGPGGPLYEILPSSLSWCVCRGREGWGSGVALYKLSLRVSSVYWEGLWGKVTEDEAPFCSCLCTFRAVHVRPGWLLSLRQNSGPQSHPSEAAWVSLGSLYFHYQSRQILKVVSWMPVSLRWLKCLTIVLIILQRLWSVSIHNEFFHLATHITLVSC